MILIVVVVVVVIIIIIIIQQVLQYFSNTELWHASSSTIFQVLITKFASMAWSTALESTVLGLPDLTWSLRFLQPEESFLNHLVTVQWSTMSSSFTQQMSDRIMVQFELVKQKFQKNITLCTYLCSFQIMHRIKQCSMCQCTNYHNSINFSGYMISTTVMRNKCCKLACTNILQNFWLTLVIMTDKASPKNE